MGKKKVRRLSGRAQAWEEWGEGLVGLGGLEGPVGQAEGIYYRRSGEHESQTPFCHFHARSVEGGAATREHFPYQLRCLAPGLAGPNIPTQEMLGNKVSLYHPHRPDSTGRGSGARASCTCATERATPAEVCSAYI